MRLLHREPIPEKEKENINGNTAPSKSVLGSPVDDILVTVRARSRKGHVLELKHVQIVLEAPLVHRLVNVESVQEIIFESHLFERRKKKTEPTITE